MTRYLWWGHGVEAIHRHADALVSCPSETWRGQLKASITNWTQERWDWPMKEPKEIPKLVMSSTFTASNEYWSNLFEIAIFALKKAVSLFQESRYENQGEKPKQDDYLVGDIIPSEALTLLCSLGLAAKDVLKDSNDAGRLQIKALRDLLKTWTGETEFGKALILALERHRYPMINRLNGLKVLIDALVLDRVDSEEKELLGVKSLEQALEWTKELLHFNTLFDAPLHFTPLHSGTTCALLWLRWIHENPNPEDKDKAKIEPVYRAAQRDLHNSEEMYSMRRAYYEAINDLYYLYDDFNDRQIHFNHAIQMAGADLTSILKHLVDLREEVQEPGAVPRT